METAKATTGDTEMKVAAMITKTGAAVYIVAERTWATVDGVIEQFAVAPVGRYAEAGIATGWVSSADVTILQ